MAQLLPLMTTLGLAAPAGAAAAATAGTAVGGAVATGAPTSLLAGAGFGLPTAAAALPTSVAAMGGPALAAGAGGLGAGKLLSLGLARGLTGGQQQGTMNLPAASPAAPQAQRSQFQSLAASMGPILALLSQQGRRGVTGRQQAPVSQGITGLAQLLQRR